VKIKLKSLSVLFFFLCFSNVHAAGWVAHSAKIVTVNPGYGDDDSLYIGYEEGSGSNMGCPSSGQVSYKRADFPNVELFMRIYATAMTSLVHDKPVGIQQGSPAGNGDCTQADTLIMFK